MNPIINTTRLGIISIAVLNAVELLLSNCCRSIDFFPSSPFSPLFFRYIGCNSLAITTAWLLRNISSIVNSKDNSVYLSVQPSNYPSKHEPFNWRGSMYRLWIVELFDSFSIQRRERWDRISIDFSWNWVTIETSICAEALIGNMALAGNGRFKKDVMVEIEKPTKRQPFLGGYRWKPTGVHFYHAATQTDYSVAPDNTVRIIRDQGPLISNLNSYRISHCHCVNGLSSPGFDWVCFTALLIRLDGISDGRGGG